MAENDYTSGLNILLGNQASNQVQPQSPEQDLQNLYEGEMETGPTGFDQLINSASTWEFKWFFATKTGAAQKIFCVKTAAVLLPFISEIKERSRALFFFMPELIEEHLTPCTSSKLILIQTILKGK